MSAKKDESSSVQSTEKQPIHDGIPSPGTSDVEIATFGTSVQFSKEEESALVRKLGKFSAWSANPRQTNERSLSKIGE